MKYKNQQLLIKIKFIFYIMLIQNIVFLPILLIPICFHKISLIELFWISVMILNGISFVFSKIISEDL